MRALTLGLMVLLAPTVSHAQTCARSRADAAVQWAHQNVPGWVAERDGPGMGPYVCEWEEHGQPVVQVVSRCWHARLTCTRRWLDTCWQCRALLRERFC